MYHPGIHQLVETHWINTARRMTGRPDLLLYYHRRHRTYVLGIWAVKPNTGKGPGLIVELETMNQHPDHYDWKRLSQYGNDRPSMAYVKSRCQPMGEMFKQYDDKLKAEAYEEMMGEEETEIEKKETAKWLMGKGTKMAEVANKILSGELPFVGRREGGKELMDQMVEVMKPCTPAVRISGLPLKT